MLILNGLNRPKWRKYSNPVSTYRDGERVQRQLLQQRLQRGAGFAGQVVDCGTNTIFYSGDVGLESVHVCLQIGQERIQRAQLSIGVTSLCQCKNTTVWPKTRAQKTDTKKSMQSDFTTKGYITRALHCFLSITVDPQVRSYLKIQSCVMPSTEAKWFLSVSLDSITTELPFRCDQQEAEAASRFQTHTGNSKRSSGRWSGFTVLCLGFDFSRTQDFYLQGAHHS